MRVVKTGLHRCLVKRLLSSRPPDAKHQLIVKDPDAGKDRRQEEKGVTEDEIVEWHHQIKGHEFEQAPDMVKDREAWCAGVHGVKKVRHD